MAVTGPGRMDPREVVFVVTVTPDQFETIRTALHAVVEAGHGDGASSQPLANALVYALSRFAG